MLTRCKHRRWLSWHDVGVGVDYRVTVSLWRWLCQHHVSIVKEYEDNVLVYCSCWLGGHTVNYLTLEKEKTNDKSKKNLNTLENSNCVSSKLLTMWTHDEIVIDFPDPCWNSRWLLGQRTGCQHSCWLLGHNVGVVVDYADTVSA